MIKLPHLSIKILLALVLAMVFVSFGILSMVSATGTSAEEYAAQIVQKCAGPGDHSSCYESTVPDLYPKVPLSEIFDVIRDIRSDDSSYQFCHVLAHDLGARVVAEDPNNWIDAIHYNPPDGLCSNGYIHGVIIGRFRNVVVDDATFQQFLPDFKKACEANDSWSPSDLDRSVCYHGMGHLFTYITNADLPDALAHCKAVVPDQFLQICDAGVFMQIFQPLEPDDYALIDHLPLKPTAANVRSFCASFTDPTYVGACLRESWPLFQTGVLNGTGVAAFCAGQPDPEQTDECYQSASAIIGRILLSTPDQVAAACNNLPPARQETCFSFSAESALEENRDSGESAVSLCERATSTTAQECLSDLANRASFDFGSNTKEYTQFCSLLPANLQTTCDASQ